MLLMFFLLKIVTKLELPFDRLISITNSLDSGLLVYKNLVLDLRWPISANTTNTFPNITRYYRSTTQYCRNTTQNYPNTTQYYIETQHCMIETQHSIVQTQHNIYGNTTLCDRRKHNVIETQHSIIQKQHIAYVFYLSHLSGVRRK